MRRYLALVLVHIAIGSSCVGAPSSDKPATVDCAKSCPGSTPPSQTGTSGFVVIADTPSTDGGGATVKMIATGPNRKRILNPGTWRENFFAIAAAPGKWTITLKDEFLSLRQEDFELTVKAGEWVTRRIQMQLQAVVTILGDVSSPADGWEPIRGNRKKVIPAPDSGPQQVILVPGIYKIPGKEEQKLHLCANAGGMHAYVPKAGEPANAVGLYGFRFVLDDAVPVLDPVKDPRAGLLVKKDKENVSAQKPRLFRRRLRHGDRVRGFEEIREIVHHVVLHTSRTDDAAEYIQKLAKAHRSVHFVIDFDGTILQLVNLVYATVPGSGGGGDLTVDIALVNAMPDLVKKPTAPAFSPKHPRAAELAKHPRKASVQRKINGKPARSYGYTEAQHRALTSLLRGLICLFPHMSRATAQVEGDDGWNVTGFDNAGVVGAFHISAAAQDPGPGFDWKRVEEDLSRVPDIF